MPFFDLDLQSEHIADGVHAHSRSPRYRSLKSFSTLPACIFLWVSTRPMHI